MRPKASRASSPNPTANLVGTRRAGLQTPRRDSRRLSFLGAHSFTFRLQVDDGKIRANFVRGASRGRFKEQDVLQRMLEFCPSSKQPPGSVRHSQENQLADLSR